MATIPLPLRISVAQFKPPVGEPTYTQIFDATMGDLGTPADGFDKNMADLGAIADALNGEMIAEAAIGSIDTALGVLGAVDLTPLDSHIGNYEAAASTGNQIVADATQAAPPVLTELPISASFNAGVSAPPAQVSIDLGTLKLGSTPLTSVLGKFASDGAKLLAGMIQAQIYTGDPAIFSVYTEHFAPQGIFHINGQWVFKVTPAKLGKFVAQLNTIGGEATYLEIRTYTVEIVA
jgi:hypothetical protein